MAQEIEIKLKVEEPRALKRRLKRLGARLLSKGTRRVHEWNIVFDTSEGRLAKRGQVLRIRTETPEADGKQRRATAVCRSLLTFKRPPSSGIANLGSARQNRHHKVREELELEVADASSLSKIFEGLGMRGWFRYEKYRTTFRLPSSAHWAQGLLIELDETPIGTFVELEGPPSAIRRAALELGFSTRDYIVKNYRALYVKECRKLGIEPRDMVFEAPKSRSHKK